MNSYLLLTTLVDVNEFHKRFKKRKNWKEHKWNSNKVDLLILDSSIYYSNPLLFDNLKIKLFSRHNYRSLDNIFTPCKLYKSLINKDVMIKYYDPKKIKEEEFYKYNNWTLFPETLISKFTKIFN